MKNINLRDIVRANLTSNLTEEFLFNFLELDGNKAALNLTNPAQDDLVRYEALLRITNAAHNSNLLVLSGSKNASLQVMQSFLEQHLGVKAKNSSLTYNPSNKNITIYFEGYQAKSWRNCQYNYTWILASSQSNILANISNVNSQVTVILAGEQEPEQLTKFNILQEQTLVYEGQGNLKSYRSRGNSI
ncbi:hypothetical protein Cylst_5544 [Cylindrospermum stagnale PCC 7417]|uniref:Uncharacterized protein n=1 Tax=Cylindrospermum stagnale PCC 7417 TaxID=56107 RepID=K9X513_9NOST|nr:hypothetical protein [Cylindrospermum stagnale]AFZ27553.1 hypothetical protein Cylst_5544 [Cylindrospermum stagnale PCC 7417]